MTIEQAKKAIECCHSGNCDDCPCFGNHADCEEVNTPLVQDIITEYDERIAIMQESMEALEKRCNTLNALEQRCKALEALEKRNEPLAPEIETQNDVDVLYRCPACHEYLFYRFQKYCCICGQAVKWE